MADKYGHLSPDDAVAAAWLNPGTHPAHHRAKQARVAREMPLLAQAIQRLAAQKLRETRERSEDDVDS